MANGDTGDVACDHYRRWEADLDLMAELGLESYRFSIAWPRVQPAGRGPVNAAGLRLLPRGWPRGCSSAGSSRSRRSITGTCPQALQDAGGWGARDTAERFAEYAAPGRRRRWATSSRSGSPTTSRGSSPSSATPTGTKAPGIRHWPTALRASHHLLLSHGLALRALRAQLGDLAQIGIALNQYPFHPAGRRARPTATPPGGWTAT